MRPPLRRALVLTVLCSLLPASAASAHGPGHGETRSKAAERRLRALEVRFLGAEHAAEHARARRAAARGRSRRRPVRTRPTARAAAISYSSDVLGTAGLNAYWRLGEAAGATTAVAARGPNGSYLSGVVLGLPGAIGEDPSTAARFDGTNDHVLVPDGTAVDTGDTFTLEAWVRRASASASRTDRIFSKGTGSYGFGFVNDRLQLRVNSSTNPTLALASVTTTDTTSWHHVVATKAGATRRLYIDGRDVTGSGTNATVANNATALNIGRSAAVSSWFHGSIDEPAVYRTALTAAQVLAHYQAGAGATPPPPPPPPPPTQLGRWLAPYGVPGNPIHAMVLHTGKVLYLDDATDNSAAAYVLDPRTGTTVRRDPPRVLIDGVLKVPNIWCGGNVILPDGRVLVTGGTLARGGGSASGWRGLATVFTFDPVSETWTQHANMRQGRWYPGQVLLPDGRVVIMDGNDGSSGATNRDIELFTPSTGQTTVIGGRGGTGQPPTGGGLYPRMFVMPSGQTLVAGPWGSDSWLFRVSGTTFSWQDVPNLPGGSRGFASSVLLPGTTPQGSSRVMLIGGYGTATATTTRFDAANPTAGWSAGPSLNVARSHHNTVILPDGTLATVGGGVGSSNGSNYVASAPQRQVELLDPVTGGWRVGPSQAEYRTYHSTAVLLPDGRVLSSGDDGNGGREGDTVEVYEPPYLHRGARPAITGAPAAVGYGASFAVMTPDAATVSRAALMAPGATTHGSDMSQRHVALALTRRADGTGVDLAAPASANLAPPGHYMLFLLNADGVPSEARFVRIG